MLSWQKQELPLLGHEKVGSSYSQIHFVSTQIEATIKLATPNLVDMGLFPCSIGLFLQVPRRRAAGEDGGVRARATEERSTRLRGVFHQCHWPVSKRTISLRLIGWSNDP